MSFTGSRIVTFYRTLSFLIFTGSERRLRDFALSHFTDRDLLFTERECHLRVITLFLLFIVSPMLDFSLPVYSSTLSSLQFIDLS